MQKIFTLLARPSLVIFSLFFLTSLVEGKEATPYGQLIQIKSSVDQNRVTGVVELQGHPEDISYIEGVLIDKRSGGTVWEGRTLPIDFEQEGERLLLSYEFVLEEVLGGSFTLYGSVFDAKQNRIGYGSEQLLFEGEEKAAVIKESSYKTINGSGIFSGKIPDGLRFEARVYDKINDVVRSTVQGGDSQVIFNLPTAPGLYELHLYAVDENGVRRGSVFTKNYTVKGEFAFILGALPDRDISNASEFVVDVYGKIPDGQPYNLALELEQTNKEGLVETKKDIVSVSAGKEFYFEAQNEFSIHDEASALNLSASVVDPETQNVIGTKSYTWTTTPSVVVVPVKEEQVKVEQNPMKFYALLALLFILGLLFYLFFSGNKQRLSGFVLGVLFFGGSVSAADISNNYTSSQAITRILPIKTYSILDTDFSQIPVEGVLSHSFDDTSVFVDESLVSIEVELIENTGGVETRHPLNPIDRKDVFFGENPGDPEYSKYGIILDINGQTLTDGIYGLNLEFVFESGNTLTAERANFLKIDNTTPSLSVNISSDLKPSRTEQDITIVCTDESSCLDQPDIGGGSSDTDKQFVAKIKGNFCEGTDNGVKVCKKNTGTSRFNEFEICDGVGNCSDPQRIGSDLFFYDPFPPRMTEIELIRVDGEGQDIRNADVLRDLKGRITKFKSRGGQESSNLREPDHRWAYTNNKKTGVEGLSVAAHAQFAFDLVDDNDTQVELGSGLDVTLTEDAITETFTVNNTDNAGPAADASACGDFGYNFATQTTDKVRTYGTDGRLSDFFFGVSVEEPTIERCRQRKVACSNGPGHSGYWDRSQNPGVPMEAKDCTVDGVPLSGACTDSDANCCPDGYVYDGVSDSCVVVAACDPIHTNTITNTNGWIHVGTPAEASEAFTFSSLSTPTTGTCTWGCEEGYIQDGSNHACTADCTDGLFPWCLDTETFGEETPASVPVIGQCGSGVHGTTSGTQPSAGLCDAGTATAITDTGSTWEWTCNGENGGANSSTCQVNKSVSLSKKDTCIAELRKEGESLPPAVFDDITISNKDGIYLCGVGETIGVVDHSAICKAPEGSASDPSSYSCSHYSLLDN